VATSCVSRPWVATHSVGFVLIHFSLPVDSQNAFASFRLT